MSPLNQALKGKVALVTGGSRGIGAAIAKRFSADGAHVVITYASNASAANQVVDDLPTPGSAIQSDLSDPSSAKQLTDKLVNMHGKVDFVILNGGIADTSIDPSDLSRAEETYDKHFNTNVKGNILLVQHLAPHIAESGRIVFFSTSLTAAFAPTPGYLNYIASKGAIEQIARVFSRWPVLTAKKVTVNTISPGPTATDGFYNGKTDELVKRLKSLNPFNEVGKPEDIAGTVRFLVSEEGQWVHGQHWKVNGGMV